MEEEKLKQLEAEKENRLRSFQKEVKQRVWKANQFKRQQLIQEAERAVSLGIVCRIVPAEAVPKN